MANAAEASSPGVGHNGLSPDQRHALALMHRRAYRVLDEEKKRIAASLRNLGRVVKADLGENGLDQIKTMIAMETPEGEEKIKARLQAQREAVAWSSDEDGQLDMFPAASKPTDSKAFMAGKIAGMDDQPCSSPYAENTADGEDWVRGWHVGRKVMDELLEVREQPDELIEGPGHDDGGDLDDEAATA